MKITVLMENTCGENRVHAEHGLSLYIETPKHNIIMDTGASPLTWENAAALGTDITKTDTVIISHGHYDHTGGVISLMSLAPAARIYMRRCASGDFYHGEKYIGIDKAILDLPALELIDSDIYEVDDELTLFSSVTGRRLWPESNLALSEKIGGHLVLDSFAHEQCLVIKEGDTSVLFSGCAHNGIVNILDRYKDIFGGLPSAVVSGFHMMKNTEYTDREISSVRETARLLSSLPVGFYTGHCTGQPAFDLMKSIMSSRLHYIHSGDRFSL